jgi:hypothetical protein
MKTSVLRAMLLQALLAGSMFAQGPVAYYPFTGNAVDSSGTGNTPTVNSATLTTDRFGAANSAYAFDGAGSLMERPYDPTSGLFPAGDIAISAWFNTSSTTPQEQAIVGTHYGGSGEGYMLQVNSWEGYRLYFLARAGGIQASLTSTNPVNDGRWHHAAVVRRGDVIQLFLDGQVQGSTTLVGAIDYNPSIPFQIGHTYGATQSAYYFTGSLDDIRIYNRALSAAEVDSLYRLGGWPQTVSLTSVMPTAHSLGVAPLSNVVLTFDGALDSSSVNASTIRLHGSYSGSISAALTYDPATFAVTADPTSSLQPGEWVTITATGGLRALNGNPISTPAQSQFVVGVAPSDASFVRTGDLVMEGSPYGVVIADLTGDGIPDLGISQGSFSNMTRLFAGNGDGTFSEQTGFQRTGALATADFNGDGNMDLAASSAGISVSLATAGGVFTPWVDYAVSGGMYLLQVVDVDADGDIDIITPHANEPLLTILVNDGNGVFSIRNISSPAISEWYGLAAGDIDGDGDNDLVMASGPSTLVVLRNSGDGDFTATAFSGVGDDPRGVALGDLDADGDLDLVISNHGYGSSTLIDVLKNDGNGSFTAYGSGTVPLGSHGIVLFDADGDEDLDVAVAGHGGGGSGNTLSIMKNDGTGHLGDIQSVTVGQGPILLAAGDLNGDGRVDLVTSNHISANASVVINSNERIPGQYDPDLHTVLLLHMNEASGSKVADASSEGNYGISIGTTIEMGRFGNARRFDGVDDFVSVANAASLNFTANEGLTYEAWIKTSDSQADYAGILAKGSPSNPFFGYQLNVKTDRLLGELSDGTAYLKEHNGLLGTSVLNDGRWHHVAVTYDGASKSGKVFVDGRVENGGTEPLLTGSFTSVEDLFIGKERGSIAFFKGLMYVFRAFWTDLRPGVERV